MRFPSKILTLLALLGAGACAASTSGSATSSSGGVSSETVSGEHGGRPVVPSSAAALRNVDVTVIYPLPDPAQVDALLAPASVGKGGPLLSKEVFASGVVPELDEFSTLPDDDARLASMRVVALRFDPCAGVLMPPKDPSSCVAQLRLVFQSLDARNPSMHARDGALHAFYRLDAASAAEIEEQLRAMRLERLADPEVPLGVHPRLAEEGPAGAFGSALRSLVLAHAGPDDLVRVTTFSRLANAFFDWQFTVRERGPDGFTDGSIATVGTSSQIVRTLAASRPDAELTPASGSPDDPTPYFDVSTAERATALKRSARVLDPRIHHSESIDCGSCHLAPEIAAFAEKKAGLALTPEDRFTSSYPLVTVPGPQDDLALLQNFHMLSYFGTTLSVTMRTANETAAVLEYLNGR